MSIAMNSDIATVAYDNLVITGGQVGTTKLTKGQGTLLRGSVIDSTGALLASGKVAKYILAEDTVVSDDDDTVAVVYKTGTFVRDSLVVADGYTFADTDAENLRDVTILVEAAQE